MKNRARKRINRSIIFRILGVLIIGLSYLGLDYLKVFRYSGETAISIMAFIGSEMTNSNRSQIIAGRLFIFGYFWFLVTYIYLFLIKKGTFKPANDTYQNELAMLVICLVSIIAFFSYIANSYYSGTVIFSHDFIWQNFLVIFFSPVVILADTLLIWYVFKLSNR